MTRTITFPCALFGALASTLQTFPTLIADSNKMPRQRIGGAKENADGDVQNF